MMTVKEARALGQEQGDGDKAGDSKSQCYDIVNIDIFCYEPELYSYICHGEAEDHKYA